MHITHYADDDLQSAELKKSEGSCEWITNTALFQQWRDDETESLLCHWLSGRAGAGKSVLSAYIIRHLQSRGGDTCFYFFRHGQEAKQTASSLLLSLAFQMASLHPSICKALTAMRTAGIIFDKDDERVIWRKFFINAILLTDIPTWRTQYWVVDGLDECVDSESLLSLLYNFEARFNIRILFSSRRLPELEKYLARFGNRLLRHHIGINDTLPDIQRFIVNNADKLPVEPEHRPQLIEKLVNKSDGAFLWIELAFEELRKVFSEEEIDEVLDQVPEGMESLYNRILEAMAKNDRQVKLTRAILEWTVCGTRPLSTEELQAALSLDLNIKLRNMDRVIEELCCQLLTIDDNGIVQILHATAREFLLSQDSHAVFQMSKESADQHLALVCLKYLNSEEMRPPRHPALVGKPVPRSAFVDYACTSFSDHLASSSAASNEVFLLLDKFLRTNVLAWAEYILRQKKNLYSLTRASKNIRRYLDRRAEYVTSVLDVQYRNIETWQTDLLRIALKFGENLLRNPACIHFLVPPLCPKDTAVYKVFGRRATKGLQLNGLNNTNWEDCICYIDHRESRARCLAGSDGFFAVGMRSGDIKLYQQSTCQQIATLVHGEPVDTIKFDNTPHYLVSASCKTLKMWTIKGQLLWTVKNVRNLSAVSFTEDGKCLVTADRYGNISILNTCNGTNAQPQDPENSSRNLNTNLSQDARWKVISVADICPRTELIAVSYRVGPPEIWSIERDAMIGTCNLSRDKPGIVHITPVSQLLFNPNPASELLAVTYQDGELAIFNKWSCGFEIKAISAYPQILAATMDGRTLASASSSGIIKLWDFETLTLLSWIRASEHDIRSMAFSDDGSRLYDLRDNGTKTKVWELSGLAKKSVPEEPTLDEPIHSQAPVFEKTERDWGPLYIEEILAPPGARCIFAGRSDGSVVVYDSATGDLISSLYTHGPGSWAFVRSVSWTRDMIASADALNNITVRTLEKVEPNDWKATVKVFEKKLEFDRDGSIRKLLFHPSLPLLLVLTWKGSLILFNISTHDRIPLSGQSSSGYGPCLWLPSVQGSVLLLGKRAMEPVIDIFAPKANDFEYHFRAAWDLGTTEIQLASAIKSISTDAGGNYLAVLSNHDPKAPPVHGLLIYNIPLLDFLDGLAQDHTEITPEGPILTIPGTSMSSFFGFHGKRLVFLDHELWVKSIDLAKVKAGSTSTLGSLTDRHFFIPRELFWTNHEVGGELVDGAVTDTGNVVFPKEGELAVVRHALEWTFVANDAD
jgi:WD40 repeat protein